MSLLFRITGIIVIICSVITLIIVGASNPLFGLFSAFLTVVLGLSIYATGSLLDRVKYIDDKLQLFINRAKYYEDRVKPQIACLKCGSIHDFDYPKCPNCKCEYKYDKENDI
jgi:hypothetical protein